jgi:hypothetical protein
LSSRYIQPASSASRSFCVLDRPRGFQRLARYRADTTLRIDAFYQSSRVKNPLDKPDDPRNADCSQDDGGYAATEG